jgi:hypothetical protein
MAPIKIFAPVSARESGLVLITTILLMIAMAAMVLTLMKAVLLYTKITSQIVSAKRTPSTQLN